MYRERQYQTKRPFIFMQRGWWIVSQQLTEKTLDGVVVQGKGRKVRTAWNDFARKYNWYKRGCPGMPMFKREAMDAGVSKRKHRRMQREAEERNAISRAVKGP